MTLSINLPMNHSLPGLEGLPQPTGGVDADRVGPSKGADATRATTPKGEVQMGTGELAGRQIRVGGGQERADALSGQLQDRADPSNKPGLWERMRTFLGLHSMATYQARSETVFEAAHAGALTGLRQAKPGSLALDAGVMSRVQSHAEKQGTKLNAEQLKELVTVGENLALKLANGEPPGIDSGVYTTRAMAWFMMAQAAAQDAQRPEGNTRSDMTNKGSFVMKDPDNRVYNFLKSAPTCSTRMSTHFAERVDHQEKHKVLGINTSKPANQGIEDFRSLMPGTGGTMLFDKMTKGELFVKFEAVGCPPYFVSSEKGGQKLSRFFCSLGRNTMHALNFLQSMFKKSGASKVERQEHVYKGTLEKSVFVPFKKLIDDARGAGVISNEWKSVAKDVKRTGLPFVNAQIDLIRQAALDAGKQEVAEAAQQLTDGMTQFLSDLVGPAGEHDIERRGAEVHISIDPSARLQSQPA